MDTFIPATARVPLRAVDYLLVAFALSGCATSSSDIGAQFVAPEKYEQLSCQQIGAEGERVARRVAEISATGYGNGGSVAWPTSQPIVVRWPSTLLATSEEGTAELHKLKGEFWALAEASTQKRCSFSFQQQAS